MAGFMKNAMSYLGMSDVAEDDDFEVETESEAAAPATSFDSDHTVTPMPTKPAAPASQAAMTASPSRVNANFQNRLSRITTIHPKSYEDAQMVGRAIRDGVPVVLNLTGVSESIAYRIVDFSAGVVFGVHGSMERVTPRVFLLSPAQVNIKVEEPSSPGGARDLFSD